MPIFSFDKKGGEELKEVQVLKLLGELPHESNPDQAKKAIMAL